jgi:FAD/FMN-containing dehydrogenase
VTPPAFAERRAASWGRLTRPLERAARPRHRAEAAALAAGAAPRLAVGMGRSYGDSCLAAGAGIVDMTGLDRLLAFDPATGLLEVEAGATLDAVMRFCVPRGFFPATTPGTRQVTVGGAIANDVHGKNHHRAGTFGRSVRRLTLARSDRGIITCSPTEEAGLFAATVGGLGLTGIILTATIALSPIRSSELEVETIPFGDLDAFFALAAASEAGFEHTVAWIDAAGRGKSFGRGLFSRANWAADGARVAHRTGRLAVPVEPPLSAVTPLTTRAFNALYFARGRAGAGRARLAYGPFFHPLDGVADWNRLYGRRGFFQYQCVLPPASARDGAAALLDAVTAAGAGSALSVLKTFGDVPSPGLLSFPMPGTTLALDLPARGASTEALLARLDAVVREAGGRLYPAKDARMPRDLFQDRYPVAAFARHLDPACTSDFWRRVGA